MLQKVGVVKYSFISENFLNVNEEIWRKIASMSEEKARKIFIQAPVNGKTRRRLHEERLQNTCDASVKSKKLA